MEATKEPGIPWPAVMTLILGSFMAYLDTSIINVAIPTLKSTFGVTQDVIEWVATSYLLVTGIVVTVTGFLSDRFGSKNTYIFALVVFTVGSGLCGMAWSSNSLIASRVIQAIGGGMLIPVSMSTIRIIVPRQRLGMAIGVWGVSAMGAPAIGPTLGGYIINSFGWEWIFTINLPIGMAAVFFAWTVLEETPRRANLRFDMLGFILSAAACFALLLALNKGQDKGWTSLYIVDLLIFVVFTFILFVIWELNTRDPLIDIRMFNNRTYCLSLCTVALSNIALYSILFVIPIYVQSIRGLTPLQSGLLTMPSAITTALMMPISGRLYDRLGAAPLCIIGFSIAAYYTYQLHTLGYDANLTELQWILVKRSIGLGLATMPVSAAGMKAMPRHLASRASAMNNLFRQIASSFGIAFVTYTMTHRQVYHAAWLSDTVNWSSYASVDTLNKLQWAVSRMGVPPALSSYSAKAELYSVLQRQAIIASIDDAVLLTFLLIIMIIPMSLFLNRKAVEKEIVIQAKRFPLPRSGRFAQRPLEYSSDM